MNDLRYTGNDIQWNEEFGLWWPDGENDSVYKRMLMRVCDVDVSIKHVRTTGVCVQAGGFIGMWPCRLAKHFERVYTFEPIPRLYECVKRNTQHLPSVRVHREALGETVGEIQIQPKRGGCSRVNDTEGNITVPQVSIDSLCLIRCDAIFLDVENYEPQALAGAAKTIQTFKPIVTLEVNSPEIFDRYSSIMLALGYDCVAKVHADRVFAPR